MKEFLVIAIPIIVAVAAGSAALYARSAGFSTGPETGTADLSTTLFVLLGLLAVLMFGLKRHPEKSARIIVSGITVAGTLSGLLLIKVLLRAFNVFPIVFLISLPFGYLGLNYSVKAFFGVLSQLKASILMTASACLVGSLVGTSLPLIVSLLFLVGLTLLDVLIVGFDLLPNFMGEKKYDEMMPVATIQTDKYLLGLGDFLAYSILATVTLRFLGFFAAILTSCLIFLGAIITLQITKRTSRAPGLMLPIGLGIIPLLALVLLP